MGSEDDLTKAVARAIARHLNNGWGGAKPRKLDIEIAGVAVAAITAWNTRATSTPSAAVGEWRTMESAPKDGTEFVGYGKPSPGSPEGAYVTRWQAYGEGSLAYAAWKRGEGPEGGYWHYEPVSNWTNTWLPMLWAALPASPTPDRAKEMEG